MVTLSGALLSRYERFSLYNSPYPAHDRGCAVDLYPGGRSVLACSPVAGTVRDTRTVRCPPKHYAVEEDHLIVLDVDVAASPVETDRNVAARVLHVDPGVEPGDHVAVGDPLGETVRSGFFGQWVDDHLHVGFRPADQNPYRASGSLPLTPGVEVDGLPWDGTGTVVETGPTHVLLDRPVHDRDGFAGIAADEGVPLDGGLVHYAGGGTLADHTGSVSLLGTAVGRAEGRGVDWHDVEVRANGRRLTGLSLFASQVEFGAKLVLPGHDWAVGDELSVAIAPTDDPVRLS